MSGIAAPGSDDEALVGDTVAADLAEGVEAKAKGRTHLTTAVDAVTDGRQSPVFVTPGSVGSERGAHVVATLLPEADKVGETAPLLESMGVEVHPNFGASTGPRGATRNQLVNAIEGLGLPDDPDAIEAEEE